MTRAIPLNPSLENLKKQAKTLLKACRRGDAEAVARVRAAHPRFEPGALRLSDCQLVLAREAGFASWPQFKLAVESANRDLPTAFILIACLCYDDPHYDHRSFHARASEMLRRNQWLSSASIWSAAAAGNGRAVAAFLDDDPKLVDRREEHGWTPLICACYSRVAPIDPSHSSLETAKLLLDRGADPNCYTLKYNDPPGSDLARRFTPLSGIFGGGSTGLANQPPHPHGRDLAELLLERGANPADEMALAINQDASLEFLLRHGLKPDATASNGITLMGRALSQAARQGNIEQVRLLIAHGARMDERFNNKLPWEHATRLGRVEVAWFLEKAGAPLAPMDDVGRFIAACMAGEETAARAILAADPDLRSRAPQDLVHRAVWTRNIEAVKLTLDLGLDPNAIEDNAAIHHAGVLAERDDILRLLLNCGASLKLRDPWYDSTGIGWADFFNYAKLRDKLLNEPGICLFDALEYGRLDRVPDILKDDPEALDRPFAKCLTREPKPGDWQTPLVRVIVRGNKEAVKVLLKHGADTTARHPDGRSLLQLADESGAAEIRSLLA
jgi:ankyrin repeat protein